jgi:mono/diheme cytochrome c family protein
MRKSVLMLAALLVSLGVLCAQTPSTAPQSGPVTGNAASGKTLYQAHGCYGCHGFNGETGNPRFVGSKSQNLASETNFVAFLRLRADQAPVTPQTRMPNYSENALSDKQAKDIYAYIRSVKSGTPELKDIPTLNSIINSASRPYKP